LLAATTLLASLMWTGALVLRSDPFNAASALLIGLGLVVMATVATVGMIVVGGRWAHRLGLASLALTVVLAVVRDIDLAWILGISTTALAFVTLLSQALASTIRKLPSASGPPPRAITPPIVLLAAPALLGLAGNEAAPWALLVAGLSAPNAAFLYSRVLPGGLIAIRLVWPAMTLALTPFLGWIAGTVAAILALGVGFTAWDRSVKASYHPPTEVGTRLRIPPELTPREVLDAAQIDEKGRRR
jgi:hypothetical protein